METRITELLDSIIHPETGAGLAVSGMVDSVTASDEKITVILSFPKARDPFAASIKRQVKERLIETFPSMAEKITVIVKEAPPRKTAHEPAKAAGMAKVKRVIAVSSAKGGVGKSTVAVNIALTFASLGYKTGILDADIYGPSIPKMLGLEGFVPDAEERDGQTYIIPAQAYGVKAMSIGFFINPDDALIWRGPMATGALKQLIHQTDWGALDILIVDMPPGTGDVHLTILGEMKVDGAIIVSTPQDIALADVVRGIAMFRSEHLSVPVLGIIENMSWFTPEDLPEKRYYIFGKNGAALLATKTGIPLLGQIPLIMPSEGVADCKPIVTSSAAASAYYEQIVRTIVQNLGKN